MTDRTEDGKVPTLFSGIVKQSQTPAHTHAPCLGAGGEGAEVWFTLVGGPQGVRPIGGDGNTGILRGASFL